MSLIYLFKNYIMLTITNSKNIAAQRHCIPHYAECRKNDKFEFHISSSSSKAYFSWISEFLMKRSGRHSSRLWPANISNTCLLQWNQEKMPPLLYEYIWTSLCAITSIEGFFGLPQSFSDRVEDIFFLSYNKFARTPCLRKSIDWVVKLG